MRKKCSVCKKYKDKMPIKQKDIANSDISKILVHNIETFKIVMKNNTLKQSI